MFARQFGCCRRQPFCCLATVWGHQNPLWACQRLRASSLGHGVLACRLTTPALPNLGAGEQCPVEVVGQAVLELPLAHLQSRWTTRPPVLLVAPLSGHFATLLLKPPAPAGRP
jgi:hypothetical protein